MNSEKKSARGAKKKSATRQRLLLASMEIFGESGFHAVTTRQIAAKAEVNLAAIPYYFGSKEQLYNECVETILNFAQDNIALLREKITGELNAGEVGHERMLELLEEFMLAMFEIIISDTVRIYAPLILREHIAPSPTFEVMYDRIFLPQHLLISRLVAGLCGLPADSRECILRAHVLVGQIIGFLLGRNLLLKRMGRNVKDKGLLSPADVKSVKNIIADNIRAVFTAVSGK